jgi:hypothetical protein
MSGGPKIWMHRDPNAVAFRASVHGAGGCGAFHRNAPTGGAAGNAQENIDLAIPGSFALHRTKLGLHHRSIRCERADRDHHKQEYGAIPERTHKRTFRFLWTRMGKNGPNAGR